MKNDYQRLLQLVKKSHAHQTRNGGNVSYWVYCYRVSKLLEHSELQNPLLVDFHDKQKHQSGI